MITKIKNTGVRTQDYTILGTQGSYRTKIKAYRLLPDFYLPQELKEWQSLSVCLVRTQDNCDHKDQKHWSENTILHSLGTQGRYRTQNPRYIEHKVHDTTNTWDWWLIYTVLSQKNGQWEFERTDTHFDNETINVDDSNIYRNPIQLRKPIRY